MAYEKRMTARRYAEQLRRAKANIATYDYLSSRDYPEFPECIILFEAKDFLIGAIESAITAMESLINHLGFIFIDNWKNFEEKNFWVQYPELIRIFKQLDINVDDVADEPYINFSSYRKGLRNAHHHVHSSAHDSQCIDRETRLHIKDDLEETGNMLNSWVNPSYDAVAITYQNTVSFILRFQDEFKNKFFHSHQLSKILSRVDETINDKSRYHLLCRYINDPFESNAFVTCNYSYK